MACKYIYKNKTYSKEEFYDLIKTTILEPRLVPKYDKILFPSGNTASVIEGHTTLEEFKKQKEYRIKKLEKDKLKAPTEAIATEVGLLDRSVEEIDNEIKQLQQELKSIETEGFGALKPIWNFYENTVTNILKKNFKVNQVTDEYGNTWNEINLSDPKTVAQTKEILFKKNESVPAKKDSRLGQYSVKQLMSELDSTNYAYKLLKSLLALTNQNVEDIKIEVVEDMYKGNEFVHGYYDTKNNSIKISQSANVEEVLAHEMIHALTSVKLAYWKKNSPEIYKKMESLFNELKDNSDSYGFQDIYEFYAELSNPEFMQELAKVKQKDFFSKVIDLFKDMLKQLGFNIQGTAAEKALNNLRMIVETNINKSEEKLGRENLEKETQYKKEKRELHDRQKEIDNTYQELIKVVESRAHYLEDNPTEKENQLGKAARGLAARIAAINKNNEETKAAIKTTASIALFVDKIKYEVIDKKSGLTPNVTWDTNDFLTNMSLNDILNKLVETYNTENPSGRNKKSLEAALQLAAHIKTYIESNQEAIDRLEDVLAESPTDKEELQEFLKENNISGTQRSIMTDIKKIKKAFNEAQEKLDKKLVYLYTEALIGDDSGLIEKSLAMKKQTDEAHNKRVGVKIKHLEIQKKELVGKMESSDDPSLEKKLKRKIAEIEKAKSELRDISENNIHVNVANEMKQASKDISVLGAYTATITDLNDQTLSLFYRRIKEKFNLLNKELNQLAPKVDTAWSEFKSTVSSLMQDSEIFKNMYERVDYLDKNGNKISYMGFIDPIEQSKYNHEYNIIAKEFDALQVKLKELRAERKDLDSLDPTSKEFIAAIQDNKRINLEISRLNTEFKDLEIKFIGTLDSKIADNHFAKIWETYQLAYGKSADYQFQQYVEEHLNIQNFSTQIYGSSIKDQLGFGMKTNYYVDKNGKIDSSDVLDISFNDTLALVANNLKTATNYKALDLYQDKNGKNITGSLRMYNRFNFSSDLLEPTEEFYHNSKIDQMNEAEKKFYDFMTNMYFEAQSKLPVNKRMKYKLPSIKKDTYQHLGDGTFNVKERIQKMFQNDLTDETTQNEGSSIPIYFTHNIDPSEVSLNLIQSVLLFTKEAMRYEKLSEVLPLAHTLKQQMGSPVKTDKEGRARINKFLEKLGIEAKVPVDKDWRNWFLDEYINQVFYGQKNTPIEVGGVRLDKMLDQLQYMASIGTLGGVKVVNQLTNLANATSANVLESMGYFEQSTDKPLFTAKTFGLSAVDAGIVAAKLGKIHIEGDREMADDIDFKIIEEIEPIQGERFNQFGNKVNKSALSKIVSTETWFLPLHIGDTIPQIQTMIAMLKDYKVELNDGSKTNLWDVLRRSENLEDNWKLIKDWESVKKDVLTDKKNYLDELNKKMHGVYKSLGDIDKPLMRKNVFGRLLETYKKFFVPMILNRYGSEKQDLERGKMVEGRMRALYRYLLKDLRWMMKEENGVMPLDFFFINEAKYNKMKEFYTDEQIVNIRKAVFEHLFIFATSILAVSLYALGSGGDDDNELIMATAAAAFRLHNDLTLFEPLALAAPFDKHWSFNKLPLDSGASAFTKIFRSPWAMNATLQQLEQLFNLVFTPTKEYQRAMAGHEKGDNMLWFKIKKLAGLTGGTDPQTAITFIEGTKN